MKKFLISLFAFSLLLLLAGCEVPSEIDKNAVINREPVCKITEPANGSTIYPTDITMIKAVIYDLDGEIDSYQFTVNGQAVPANLILPVPGNDTTFYYQGTMLGIQPNANNAYVIKAVAKDNGGKEKSNEFVLQAGNKLPTCKIGIEGMVDGYFNPGDKVKITCTATDLDKNSKSIAKVVFKIRGTEVSTDTSAPYEYLWDTAADGSLVLSNAVEAVAYDNKNQTTSDDTTLFKNILPVVSDVTPNINNNYYINPSTMPSVKFSVKTNDPESKIDSVALVYGNKYIYTTVQKKDLRTWEVTIPTSELPLSGLNFRFKIVDHYNNAQNNGVLFSSPMSVPVALFYDGFESYADFDTSSVLGTNWVQKDFDKGKTYIIGGHQFANQGYTGSYIVFNSDSVKLKPDAQNPNPTPLGELAFSGDKFAACFAAEAAYAPNNDWLVSRKISGITANSKVSFWARSRTSQYGLEKFNVYVSKTGTNAGATGVEVQSGADIVVGDFKKISAGGVGVATQAPTDTWTRYEYDLSAYAGQEIHIAVVCRSNDAFIFMLDDFMVSNGSKNAMKSPAVKFRSLGMDKIQKRVSK